MSQAETTTQSDEKSEESLIDAYAIGRRIQIGDDKGTIRYVGPVATSKKESTVWVGIEWDNEGRGKHDGSVSKDGKTYRYFDCLPTNGSFAKPVKIMNDEVGFGFDLLSVILNVYSLDDLDSDLAQQESIAKNSNYKIEFVGWKQSMERMCDLPKRKEIGLDRANCACIVNFDNNLCKQKDNEEVNNKLKLLRETVPKMSILDLRRSLLSSVNNLYGIHCFSDTLVDLNLSHNQLNMFYCFDNNNQNAKSFDIFNAIFKDCKPFANLKRLVLSDTASLNYANVSKKTVKNDENKDDASEISRISNNNNNNDSNSNRNRFHFNPWEFLYYLILNNCIPNIVEFEIYENHLNTFELWLPKSGDMSNEKDDWGMRLPDRNILLKNVPNLQLINIGNNPLSNWSEVAYLFGQLPKLAKLQANWCEFETIAYNSGNMLANQENESKTPEFAALKTLYARNNQFTNITLFDELNKFPQLWNVLFQQSKFSSIYGDIRLRDFAIAKIKNMFVCNLSTVQDKERHDAELFYLKYITAQVLQMNLTKNNDSNESKTAETSEDLEDPSIAEKIESLFPRYKELVSKYGAVKQKKVESNAIETAAVRLRSMDPKSITSEMVEKQLPINMTVAQLKMLMKRYFKLHPKHQRLMMREKGSEQMPIDLGADNKTLAYCGVKDGMEILMQSNDFEKKSQN